MVKISLLTIILAMSLLGVARAKSEPDNLSSSTVKSSHHDIDHTINALFSDYSSTASGGDLWDRIRNGFNLPNLDMLQVAEQENYYSKHPEYIQRIVNRSSRYLYHVVSEVQRRGMPMELALLPIVESAYNPRAESHAKASGMWQFIPSTGKMYGLERTWWYDGRRDVVAATDAALNYLQRLYDIFGDWPLALAAYNWGDGSVKRAQAKNIARGLSTDYTAINMPNETRNYVPKLIAIRNIIANPLAFGIKLAMVPDQPYFTMLKPQRHMDISIAAKLAEITVEELLHLNPGYIRPVIAHKENRHLVLPIDKAEVFKRNLAQYNKPLLNWQPYTTKRGESFQEIALKYGITLDELRSVNSLAANIHTARGQTLLVPIQHALSHEERKTVTTIAAHRDGVLINKNTPETTHDPLVASYREPGVTLKPQPTQAISPSDTTYVKKTPQSITQTLDNFRLFNGSSQKVSTDQDKNPAIKTHTRHYKVKRGETVYSIAKSIGITPQALVEANHIHNNQLRVDQVLIIPTMP